MVTEFNSGVIFKGVSEMKIHLHFRASAENIAKHTIFIRGCVAQRLERALHKRQVSGSNPLAATNFSIRNITWAVSVAWLNASPCHGEDQGFESPTARSQFLMSRY